MSETKLFRIVIFINIASMLFYLAVIAYLGTFTRYISDDYCEAVRVTESSPAVAVLERYAAGEWRASSRYSNLLFVGLTEFAGAASVQVLPVLMIGLWLAGLAWSSIELNKTAGIGWPREILILIAFIIAFVAILQAPNRYQVLYWRSSMATHFAPLVFLSGLLGYVFLKIRSSASIWTGILLLLAAFMIGGFSEPPVAVMITGLSMAVVCVWFMTQGETRRRSLFILGSTFGGALLALLAMVLAPSTSGRLADPSLTLFAIMGRSFHFGFEFVLDWLRTLPLPALFTAITSFVLFTGLYSMELPFLFRPSQKGIWITLLVTPLLVYLLICASFAPSAFAQSYPVERARFAGQLFMVIALMVEGAGLGILFTYWKPRLVRSMPLAVVSAVLLLIAALYPLRAGWLALADVPEYRARAEAWDERDIEIRSLIAQGQTDLIIPQASGIYGIKELDMDPKHWVNRCAADYYGVHSIRAVSVKP